MVLINGYLKYQKKNLISEKCKKKKDFLKLTAKASGVRSFMRSSGKPSKFKRSTLTGHTISSIRGRPK